MYVGTLNPNSHCTAFALIAGLYSRTFSATLLVCPGLSTLLSEESVAWFLFFRLAGANLNFGKNCGKTGKILIGFLMCWKLAFLCVHRKEKKKKNAVLKIQKLVSLL
jgi:hypothetical protein